MKRLVSLMLAGALCIGLCACSKNGESDADVTGSTVPEVTVTASADAADPSASYGEDVTPDEVDVSELLEAGDEETLTEDYPFSENSDLSKEEKLDELTYSVSPDWPRNEADGGQTVTYDGSNAVLTVKAEPISEDTEAVIAESEQSNNWDGLLAIWTQALTAPNATSWYDALQVYVPGSRIAWEINATSDDVNTPQDELDQLQSQTSITIMDSGMQYRGLVIVGDTHIYTISYSLVDLFMTEFTTDWNNLVASCQIGDGDTLEEQIQFAEKQQAQASAEPSADEPSTTSAPAAASPEASAPAQSAPAASEPAPSDAQTAESAGEQS